MRRLLLFLALLPALSLAQRDYHIIPQPKLLDYGPGSYELPQGWSARQARHQKDPSLGKEAYALSISEKGVTISASTRQGFFYGEQTLAQIVSQSDGKSLRCLTLSDEPRFAYRGLMLDVVRCFIPKDEILKVIDVASQLKINNLHLHLTDDNGWRVEIKKYPKLTQIGAWRVARDTPFPNRENPREGEPTPVGGYYTQKELRDIVAYAKKRHVNVVPEIEMPAHSVAAIASYPEMTCPVVGNRFIGVLPGIGGKDASIIYCAGNERVYRFLQDILDEVIGIFPSEYIHIGGDEAEKSHWRACSRCQDLMKREGIADEEHLQGYFMDRIIRHLKSKGRKAMGWDEVTLGHPSEDITIFGWQGYGQAAVKEARENGRPFILTPARRLYLIRYQGPQWFEPYTYFGNNTLHDVYSYEPVADDWTPEMQALLRGLQASLWTEFCQTADDVEYLLFPRLMALADNAWRAQGQEDWRGFLKALDAFLPALSKKGINYARSMYNIQHSATPTGDGRLEVNLECERNDVEICYTTDRTEPTAQSARFQKAAGLKVEGSGLVKAATFKGNKQMGKTLTLPFSANKATGRKVAAANCTNGLASVLTNGLRGTDRHSDFEWAGWYNADAVFTIDLGAPVAATSVTIGTLSNCNMTVAMPCAIYVYGSNDNQNFTLIGRETLDDSCIFSKLPSKTDVSVAVDGTANRYIRVKAIYPGTIPAGFLRGGQAPWMYFDEIIVE